MDYLRLNDYLSRPSFPTRLTLLYLFCNSSASANQNTNPMAVNIAANINLGANIAHTITRSIEDNEQFLRSRTQNVTEQIIDTDTYGVFS